MKTVAIIGGGVGGLTAATRLAKRGARVCLFEASSQLGGLASGVEAGGEIFDGGPYILLDRPGLEWAYMQLGYSLSDVLMLKKIERVYEVIDSGHRVRFYGSAGRTANAFEQAGLLNANTYLKFVEKMTRTYSRLAQVQRARPNFWTILKTGAWRETPFLFKSLREVFEQWKISGPVLEALGIWTHIAGQKLNEAPSPLALIPAVVHSQGCFVPEKGIREIPSQFSSFAKEHGVEIHLNTAIARIETKNNRALAVQTLSGKSYAADAVISNISAIGTYTHLVDVNPTVVAKLRQLPLQSPGFCIYLRCQGRPPEFYLRFLLDGGRCTLFVAPSSLNPEGAGTHWTARLIRPLKHGSPEERSVESQKEEIEELLEAKWWQEGIDSFEVLKVRSTMDWASNFHLYERSMNPVMTAKFMRQGRFPHRSQFFAGLYHCGSSTHPGQWVSFAAISGILAADEVLKDL